MDAKKVISLRDNGSVRVATQLPERSIVDQSFKESTDINNIIHRYKRTNLWPGRQAQPQFMDWASVPDLQTAMNVVAKAQSSFSSLPASVRNKFHNNPAMLVEWLQDPKNQAEAYSLGLTTVPASNDDDSTTTMSGSNVSHNGSSPASRGAPAPHPNLRSEATSAPDGRV